MENYRIRRCERRHWQGRRGTLMMGNTAGLPGAQETLPYSPGVRLDAHSVAAYHWRTGFMNMNHTDSTSQPQLTTRRDFLKTSAAAGAVLAAPAMLSSKVFAAENSDTLRVGLIGCGGRGTGAAGQALHADKNAVLVAMADVFPEPINKAIDTLQKDAGIAARVNVTPENRFVGLDAYQKLIDSGVDVVLQASPPGFRPVHTRAAVAAGKHQFVEKPVATDTAGVRLVMESAKLAAEKKLAWMAGFCWRYETARREFYKQILDLLRRPRQANVARQRASRRDGRCGMAGPQLVQFRLAFGRRPGRAGGA
jgi:hypothetical protein